MSVFIRSTLELLRGLPHNSTCIAASRSVVVEIETALRTTIESPEEQSNLLLELEEVRLWGSRKETLTGDISNVSA